MIHSPLDGAGNLFISDVLLQQDWLRSFLGFPVLHSLAGWLWC
jgi:hypothetical protein